MYIFNSVFSGKSKRTGNTFFQVKLFERRINKDQEFYFKEIVSFVEEDVYNDILSKNFNFGDIVEIEKDAPAYFGGSEQLVGLKLVECSPFVD